MDLYKLLVEMYSSVATMDISTEAPQKTENRTAILSSYATLKESKVAENKGICKPMFIVALLTMAKL
jgi:hypothetical protein